MYVQLNQCPLCQGGHFDNHQICKDYAISQESFAIVECHQCHLRFTNPRPAKENYLKYYKSDDYTPHSTHNTSLIGVVYRLARSLTVRKKLNLIQRFIPLGKILDVGCGTGEFLAYCRKNKWEVDGMEPNPRAQKIAAENISKPVYSQLTEVESKQQYHVITLWHVLEHVAELKVTIDKVKELLTSSGILLIAVPNCQSRDADHYKSSWAGYDVPRHLYHFTPETMKLLGRTFGLRLVEIIPMNLDAFYVSFLSEKYLAQERKSRFGFWSYIRGFVNGMRSNQWAKKNENNYSSLTYIFQV